MLLKLIIFIIFLFISNIFVNEFFKTYVNVKVSKTPKELKKGLMFVKHLNENEGMLFKYPNIDNHKFWMKNTFIPLDVIYFDENYRVIGFIENNKPHDLTIKGINKPSKSFLEVNSGYIKKNNIKLGNKFMFKIIS